MKYLLTLLLATLGCSRTPTLQIDPEFNMYITMFEADATLQQKPTTIKDLILRFNSEMPDILLGRCYEKKYLPLTPIIEINPRWWTESTDTFHRIVLYHELGHCILGRHHTRYSHPMGYPTSIMFTWGVAPELFMLHEEYYVHELFYPYHGE